MKKLILLSLLTLQFGLLAAQNADGQGRLSRLFNFGWKFHAGDLKDAYSVNMMIVAGVYWICLMTFK